MAIQFLDVGQSLVEGLLASYALGPGLAHKTVHVHICMRNWNIIPITVHYQEKRLCSVRSIKLI